ncbi:MAG: fimbrial biogenesis chaperone [Kluyvera sp.]
MKKYLFSLLFASLITLPAYAGFSLGQTRVIYNQAERQSTLRLINSGKDEYFLVQAWIEEGDEGHSQRAGEFIITPPVFKFQPDSENTLLIKALNDNFPTDRESLYYINVKAIPAVDNAVNNKITFATKSVIKLIYRPRALNAEDAATAWQKLVVTQQDGAIAIKNPTPYIINIGVFYINGRTVKISYIPPLAEKKITLKPNERAGVIEYNVISDFGGASELHKVKL